MSDALRWVRAENPSPMTLDGTRTYIVGRDRPIVIDPGPMRADHVAAVTAALAGAAPVAVLLTHHHPDHAAGARAIAGSIGAPVLAGLTASPDPIGAVDGILKDGDTFESDVGTVAALATPGHSPDHFAFAWTGTEAPRPGGAVFAGDLMLGTGDTALVAAPEGDVAAYLESLDRVRARRPAVIYPAHGPPITEPEIAIAAYRHHRLERVRQGFEALRDLGPASAAQLIDAVYGGGLDPRLRWAAEASLLAILEHLRARGAATRTGDGLFVALPHDTDTDSHR